MFSTEKEDNITILFNELGYDYKTMIIDKPYNVKDKNYQLLTKDGKWNDVEYIIRKPDAEMYVLTVGDSIMEVAGTHAFLCRNKNDQNKEVFIMCKELLDGNYQVYYLDKWCDALVEKTEFIIPIVDFHLNNDNTYESNGFISHNSMFGDKYGTSGGHALAFHASVRLRLTAAGQIKGKVNGVEQVIGIKTQVKVVKNRCGPPLRKTEFNIFFASGIDDKAGWLEMIKTYKLAKIGGAWYTITDVSGKEHKFQAKEFEQLLIDEPHLHDFILGKICEAMTTKYKKSELSESDIRIDTEEAVPEG